jgi:hypothetical protein
MAENSQSQPMKYAVCSASVHVIHWPIVGRSQATWPRSAASIAASTVSAQPLPIAWFSAAVQVQRPDDVSIGAGYNSPA